jgi:DNA-binding NarL/FixJ family response regulator
MSAHPQHPPGTQRVLIVDRPGPGRRALAAMLAGLSRTAVVGAEDAGPGLVHEVERLRPDVVVIDDRALAQWTWPPAGPRARMIVVGADDDPGYAARAARAGADAWVPKECSAELLAAALRRATRRAAPRDRRRGSPRPARGHREFHRGA